jgi:hypothetical protein
VPGLLNALFLGIPQAAANSGAEARTRALQRENQAAQNQQADIQLGQQMALGGVPIPFQDAGIAPLAEQTPEQQGRTLALLPEAQRQSLSSRLIGPLTDAERQAAQAEAEIRDAELGRIQQATETSRIQGERAQAGIEYDRAAAELAAAESEREADEASRKAYDARVKLLDADIDNLAGQAGTAGRALDNLTDALDSGTLAGQTAAIYSFLDTLDPGARKTEGDIQAVRGGLGQSSLAQTMFSSIGWTPGQKLTPDQRDELKGVAELMYRNYMEQVVTGMRGIYQNYPVLGSDVVDRRFKVRTGVDVQSLAPFSNMRSF